MDWQPISSAPRDGTVIVAYWSGGPVDAKSPRRYAATYFIGVEWFACEPEGETYAEPDFWLAIPEPPQP